MDKPKSTRNYSAPALEKGFDILELLAKEKKPLSLVQISVKLGRSKSELFRMLSTLEHRGYLQKHLNSDNFQITNKLFDLGMSVPPTGTLLESAFPLMHMLSKETNLACHLSVASGDQVVVIARVESPANVGLAVRVGHHVNTFESSAGLVHLAYLSEKEQQKVLSSYEQTYENFDMTQCLDNISTIFTAGYAETKSQFLVGVVDISYPIFIRDNQHVIACVTIPYLKGKNEHLTIKATRKLIASTAKQLSQLSSTYGGF